MIVDFPRSCVLPTPADNRLMSIPFITLRKFRHPRRLKAWLSVGKTVELLERDRVIAQIIPEKLEEALVNRTFDKGEVKRRTQG